MSSGTLGRIEEFNPAQNDLESYIERLEQYFVANNVTTEEKRTAVLLSVIGPKAYEVLKSLIAPDKPSGKSYQELKSSLLAHYKPKPLVIYGRFKFHKAIQSENESIAEYIAKLRSLAHHCEFNQFLDESLRDKFVVCAV
ncbi:Pol polyprotein [Plakobranchus ocellatus]|uniref:Pol polyprotein n=1 Tax=Plakobranchus ocellatus TaxID=259542 RepID=A0AAV4D297_9GAST|nr:Pol polyprotein [Plakobranchus ocellatus]